MVHACVLCVRTCDKHTKRGINETEGENPKKTRVQGTHMFGGNGRTRERMQFILTWWYTSKTGTREKPCILIWSKFSLSKTVSSGIIYDLLIFGPVAFGVEDGVGLDAFLCCAPVLGYISR